MPVVFSDRMPNDPWLAEEWYNTLDCCVTLEVHEILSRKNTGALTYEFERAMQGPALDMMLTGIRVDPVYNATMIDKLEKRRTQYEARLNQLAEAIWAKPLNPRSPDQLKAFLYGPMNLPEMWISQKGVKKLSTNRETLEKLREQYYIAQPIVNCVLGAREATKKLGVLRTGIDPDGRLRCSYGVAATETGRWASRSNVFGRGTNLQNITEELRRGFVADPGWRLMYLDGEQAESRFVGLIQGARLGDWTYLDACESGDLHTYVTKLVWPNLPWTGDPAEDREIADAVFYLHFTYRDMAKRGGHGTSYYGTAWTMSRHLKVPVGLIETFQAAFAKGPNAAFPAFPRWWQWVSQTLMADQSMTTLLGRERTFFDRPNDEATLRKAIAYEPQSCVADIVNRGIYNIWKKYCLQPDPWLKPCLQVHDAGVFLIRDHPDALKHIPEIAATFEVPVTRGGRTLRIPAEAKLGWNWAGEDPKRKTWADGNPDGLRKWKGASGDTRKRVEQPTDGLLDRRFC